MPSPPRRRLAARPAGSAAAVPSAASRLTPTWTPRRLLTPAVSAVLVLLALVAAGYLDLRPDRVRESMLAAPDLAARALPPDFSVTGEALAAALETVWMTVLGTTLSVLLAAPLAVLAARNTTPHPAARLAARGAIVVCRAIPDVVFALFFVAATGIGPLPGVLALALHSVGMLGRLFSEAVERIDHGPVEAAAAAGATPLQRLTGAVFPQVTPALIAAALYRVDINFRSATLLGFIGAGGLGVLLQRYGSAPTTYPQLAAVVIVIIACCLVFEGVAVALRRTVAGPLLRSPGHRGSARTAPVPAFDRDVLRVPWTAQRRHIWGLGVLAGAAVAGSAVAVDVTPADLTTLGTGVLRSMAEFVPTPATLLDRAGGVTLLEELLTGLVETLAVAMVAIVACTLLAVPLGLLAAGNVAPSRWVYGTCRTLLVLWRALPESVLAILGVAVLGLEPLTAVVVLTLGIFPFLAKLVADVAEEIRPGPREAVLAAGATRLQELAAGVWSQLAPSVASSVLYALDVMVRALPVLGIVGVGQLGFLLSQSFRGLAYDISGAIILLLFITVLAIQAVSDRVRAALL